MDPQGINYQSSPQKQPFSHGAKNNMRNTIIIGTIVILFIATNITAYFLARNSSQQTITQAAPPDLSISVEPTLPPATISSPPEDTLQTWKKYRTSLYSLRYPETWSVAPYPGVENGIQIFNPGSITPSTSSSSASTFSEYVIISHHLSKETVTGYVDKIQLNCCIGPSAVPGAANKFRKQDVTINTLEGQAYSAISSLGIKWNFVLTTGYDIIEIFTSLDNPIGNSLVNQILSTFVLSR